MDEATTTYSELGLDSNLNIGINKPTQENEFVVDLLEVDAEGIGGIGSSMIAGADGPTIGLKSWMGSAVAMG
jgi:hypothetical protein